MYTEKSKGIGFPDLLGSGKWLLNKICNKIKFC